MARIYVADRDNKADAKVFLVDHDYKADLCFFEVDKDYNAKGDELWFFVDKQHDADFWSCQKDWR